MGSDPFCRVCGRPRSDHRGRHMFIGPGDPLKLREGPSRDDRGDDAPASQGPVRSLTGGDPVLRMALIRKGLISPEDLDEVERELGAAGIATSEPLG